MLDLHQNCKKRQRKSHENAFRSMLPRRNGRPRGKRPRLKGNAPRGSWPRGPKAEPLKWCKWMEIGCCCCCCFFFGGWKWKQLETCWVFMVAEMILPDLSCFFYKKTWEVTGWGWRISEQTKSFSHQQKRFAGWKVATMKEVAKKIIRPTPAKRHIVRPITSKFFRFADRDDRWCFSVALFMKGWPNIQPWLVAVKGDEILLGRRMS